MGATGADASMEWHDIQNPDDKLLGELAARCSLHPLHVEDCRQDAQRTKAETGDSYLFISLKQLPFDDAGRLSGGDVVLFVGRDFLLTVHRTPVPLLEPLRAPKHELRPDQVLYLERGIERLEGRCSAPLGPPCWRKLVRPVAFTGTAACPDLDASRNRSVAAHAQPADQPGTVSVPARRAR